MTSSRYWLVKAAAEGELAPGADIDFSTHPPQVQLPRIRFNYPPESDLLEVWPVLVVSKSLKDRLVESKATGLLLRECKTLKDSEFDILFPRQTLPQYWQLVVVGIAGADDVAWIPTNQLVVSEKVLHMIRSGQFFGCTFREWCG